MTSALIIDDDPDFRALLRHKLERMGFDVTDAANGRIGLDRFSREGADLVVVDIFMPEKDGLETIKELRRRFPDCKVIAVSAGGTVKNLDFLYVARQFGADEVLVKPFTTEQLQEAVRNVGL